MSAGEDHVRAALAGADRAFAVIDGGKGRKPPDSASAEDGCPVTAIGHRDGIFFFLDAAGQKVEKTARAVGNRHDLIGLFGGRDTWLRIKFPKTEKRQVLGADNVPQFDAAGKPVLHDVTVDFTINAAAKYLMQECFAKGLFGDQIVLRRPGVWPHDDTALAVHCGDQVRLGTVWLDAGYRSGNTIWAAAPPIPRPGTPCDTSIGVKLQADIQAYWCFRTTGCAIAIMGLLGVMYLGGGPRWRSSGYLLGDTGCGKSSLLEVLAACCPLHYFSNDTTKAGLEGGLDGRAMPCFLDENERSGADQRGSQYLLDLVLTASGGAGTRGVRGTADGKSRRIEVVSSVIMAATAEPEMRSTHLGRFLLIHLNLPEEGADFRVAHANLADRMRGLGAELWGRALSAWERFGASLNVFRAELQRVGCHPREMDQFGAILAGWWILTHDAVPDARGAREGVLALDGLVRTASVVAEQSNSRQLVQYLLSSAVQMDRSSAREPIASLVTAALRLDLADPGHEHIHASTARRVLATYGMRVICEKEPPAKNIPAPRLGDGAGIWFATRNKELKSLFANSDWAGTRWLTGLRELPSAKMSDRGMRIGDLTSHAVWVSLNDINPEPEPEPEWC